MAKLGASRITSLTQGSKSANFCAEQYNKIRDEALRRHIWNFAKARAKLAQLSAAPAFGFERAFQLPDDWLRVCTVHDNENASGGVIYAIEGRTLLSDASDIYLSYVRLVSDVNTMTSDFRELLALKLAVDGCIPIVNSNTLKADLRDQLKDFMQGVRSTDAIEDYPKQMPNGSWITERDDDQSQFDSWAS